MKQEQANPIVKIRKPKTRADKFFSSFPIVTYEVTTMLGLSEIGELREARLISSEGDRGLIYHPWSNDGGS